MYQISCFFLLCSVFLIDNSLTLSAQKMVHALARTENPDFHSCFPTDLHQQCNNLKFFSIYYPGPVSNSEDFYVHQSSASIFSLSNNSPSISIFKKTGSPKKYLFLPSQNSHRLLDHTTQLNSEQLYFQHHLSQQVDISLKTKSFIFNKFLQSSWHRVEISDKINVLFQSSRQRVDISDKINVLAEPRPAEPRPSAPIPAKPRPSVLRPSEHRPAAPRPSAPSPADKDTVLTITSLQAYCVHMSFHRSEFHNGIQEMHDCEYANRMVILHRYEHTPTEFTQCVRHFYDDQYTLLCAQFTELFQKFMPPLPPD